MSKTKTQLKRLRKKNAQRKIANARKNAQGRETDWTTSEGANWGRAKRKPMVIVED